MALTWQGGAQSPVVPTEHGVVLTLYPAFNVTTGLSSTDEVEVRRAPDVAGAPGTPVTIARLDPLPARGYVFVDQRPNTTAVWWYSHRHVVADGAFGGAWSAWQKATVKPIVPGDDRYAGPPAMSASSAISSSRYRTRLYNSVVQSVPSGAYYGLTFDSEFEDVGGLHDTGANTARIVIPSINYLGVWQFSMKAQFAANATGFRELSLGKNGTLFSVGPIRSAVGAGSVELLTHTDIDVDPAPGAYYEAWVHQNSGGNLDVTKFFNAIHLW